MQPTNPNAGTTEPDDPRWEHVFEEAFALLKDAPVCYQELLRPVVIEASQDPALLPFVKHMVSNPFLRYLLSGGEVEAFLPPPEDPGPYGVLLAGPHADGTQRHGTTFWLPHRHQVTCDKRKSPTSVCTCGGDDD